MVEPWALDRSVLYSCEKFDIHKNPNRFIRVITGYTLMSDDELGMNTYVKEDKAGKCSSAVFDRWSPDPVMPWLR